MKLNKDKAEIFVPDGKPIQEAVARTTHMGISAHQDDIEIMAFHGVLECFGKDDKWFMGVVVTNGAGSPRDDLYANYTDEQMQTVRRLEQKKAAFVGEYSAQALLDYSSAEVKDSKNQNVVDDLKKIFELAKPEVVYTHNLGDKHDTHVATTMHIVRAIRALPKDARPKKLLGCEVWRDLDWMSDEDKIPLNVEAHENIASAVLGVHDSQICGGKRYDLATLGRRRAHATYFASHGTDACALLNFAMDLTPLIEDDSLDVNEYLKGFISRFQGEVTERVGKFA
ncbi:PIG-L family deacetylase [bacterium]|nr:PIG-L family deacetylase [bacterium]